MRFMPKVFEHIQNGIVSPNGRVTVEPNWRLNKTQSVYANSIRGPYRWFQDVNQSGVEYEIPNIRSISWNRSLDNDIATCTIVVNNVWHDLNEEGKEEVLPRVKGQLGRPGYFWPKHGQANDGEENEWGQTPGKGAYKRNGEWDPDFSWDDVIVPNALIRTYEGYGGHHEEDRFVSIDEGLLEQELHITGVWLVDDVSATAKGVMTITCRDIGRILLDQKVFPPLIPPALYPLEYYPAGKTPFDSFWGPKSDRDQWLGSKGEIYLKYKDSSLDQRMGARNVAVNGHRSSDAVDGDWNTFSWSYGHPGPSLDVPEWIEFEFNQPLSSLSLKAWAGGYVCYISIKENGVWQEGYTKPATETSPAEYEGGVVPGSGINYVKKVNIPLAIPDNMEPVINIDINKGFDNKQLPIPYNKDKKEGCVIRLSFDHLYYSGYSGSHGDYYRFGIRDLIGYTTGEMVGPYSSPMQQGWSFAMCAHPTRGYWVVDSTGYVHGFGDAADADSSGWHGQSSPGGWTLPGEVHSLVGWRDWYRSLGLEVPRYASVGIDCTPDGKGVVTLDASGTVHVRGTARDGGVSQTFGGSTRHPDVSNNYFHMRLPQNVTSAIPGAMHYSRDIRVPPINVAVDIAMTYTGKGYWVLYSDGLILGFGDAEPKIMWLPYTNTQKAAATAWAKAPPDANTASRYRQAYNGRAICAHPSKIGFWAVNGSGEVFTGGKAGEVPENYGGLVNRRYNRGMGDSFTLGIREFATSMDCTKDGDGYWISFGSGKVAGFGAARDKGPVNIYPGNPLTDVPVNKENIDLQAVFRSLVWSIARDPDGTGFWVLTAGGSVYSYDAEFWGTPGYTGLTGYRWHEGNFDGDWSAIVKELLLWSGFTLYNPELDGEIVPNQPPEVYGGIESTGIKTDTFVSGDKFDKRAIIDVIKELAEVVAYDFLIREDGSVEFSSPNIWKAGNFDRNGQSIYVIYDERGLPVRVGEDHPDAQPFIPVVDELVDLFDYSATLSSQNYVSEIIIGTDAPDPKNPHSTGFVRKQPKDAENLRGIEKPALWISQLFQSEEELSIMAELIAIRLWFAERTGSAVIMANPCFQLGDQIQLKERNTNETFIHLLRGIDSTNDLEEGVWTYNITTNWLGDANNWVISTESHEYITISERLDRWQQITQRGLEGPQATPDSGSLEFTLEFTKSAFVLPYNVELSPDEEVAGELPGDDEEELDDDFPPSDPNDAGYPTLIGGEENWGAIARIKVYGEVRDAYLKNEMFSRPLGSVDDTSLVMVHENQTVLNSRIPRIDSTLHLGTLGRPGELTEYVILMSGPSRSVGAANFRLSIGGSGIREVPASSSTVIVRGEDSQ